MKTDSLNYSLLINELWGQIQEYLNSNPKHRDIPTLKITTIIREKPYKPFYRAIISINPEVFQASPSQIESHKEAYKSCISSIYHTLNEGLRDITEYPTLYENTTYVWKLQSYFVMVEITEYLTTITIFQ